MRVGFEVRETVAMFRRILDGFAEWVRPEPAPPQVAPPEPSVEFSHPKNAELFTLLKRWWFESSTRSEGEYLRVHPDLIERFRNLAATSNVRQGAVYLRAVIANQSGLIFAWATGMNGIFLRLPRQLQQAAIQEGGRFDPTYGQEWIEFNAWGRSENGSEWERVLKRWIQIAYQDSLNLKTDS